MNHEVMELQVAEHKAHFMPDQFVKKNRGNEQQMPHGLHFGQHFQSLQQIDQQFHTTE